VIDIQESFRADPESWAKRSNSSFEKNVTKLIAKFRQSGEPIIFILHQNWTPGNPFHPDSPHCRFMDWIRSERNDIVLRKGDRLDSLAISTTRAPGIGVEPDARFTAYIGSNCRNVRLR
jgi:nicotinamidase-related amidase